MGELLNYICIDFSRWLCAFLPSSLTRITHVNFNSGKTQYANEVKDVLHLTFFLFPHLAYQKKKPLIES